MELKRNEDRWIKEGTNTYIVGQIVKNMRNVLDRLKSVVNIRQNVRVYLAWEVKPDLREGRIQRLPHSTICFALREGELCSGLSIDYSPSAAKRLLPNYTASQFRRHEPEGRSCVETALTNISKIMRSMVGRT